jgi:hypothetical protein
MTFSLLLAKTIPIAASLFSKNKLTKAGKIIASFAILEH